MEEYSQKLEKEVSARRVFGWEPVVGWKKTNRTTGEPASGNVSLLVLALKWS